MNAKQKRKAKQMEKGESAEDSISAAVKGAPSDDKQAKAQTANGKTKKPFAGKQQQQQKSGGKPGAQKQNKRPKVT